MDRQQARNLNNYIRLISAALLLLAGFNSFASNHFPLPANHHSVYSVSKYGTEVGKIENHFEVRDGQIRYTSKATTTGVTAFFFKEVVTETSILNWPDNDTTTKPKQVSYKLKHKQKKRKNQNIIFDWNTDNSVKISSTYKNKSSTTQSRENVWSRQLIPILMSSDLQQNSSTSQNSFLIANKGHLKNYHYNLIGQESAIVNNKTLVCLKFKIKKQGSNRESFAWLSKEHNYMPVKIEQYKNKELDVSMILKKFKRLK